jgi:hypothetical protein
MTKMKFKIFATNGKEIWELFFIIRSDKGDFYFGISEPDLKFSRHISGRMHSTVFHDIIRQRLTEFKGVEQLNHVSFSKEGLEKRNPSRQYTGGKFDGSAFIDIRNYKKLLGISVFLLEPNQVHELITTGLMNTLFKNAQITIFTQSFPWIAVIANEPS